MRKRLWWSLLPLLFALVCPGAPVQSRGPAGCCCGADQKDDPETKDVASWVCPLYCWGNFGSYCGYYARNCDGTAPQYVNLNWDCGKPSNNCDTPDNTKCVAVGSYYYLDGAAKKHHHHGKNLEAGVDPADPVADHIHPPNKDRCTKLGKPIYAGLKIKANDPYVPVMLYMVLFTPPDEDDRPASIQSTGLEVKKQSGKFDITIPQSSIIDISPGGKICAVQVGGVVYEVILGKNRVAEYADKPMKGKPAQPAKAKPAKPKKEE